MLTTRRVRSAALDSASSSSTRWLRRISKNGYMTRRGNTFSGTGFPEGVLGCLDLSRDVPPNRNVSHASHSSSQCQ